MIAVSIVVGFIVGILSGLLGVGGGTIMVPVLKIGYAMTAIASTATSLFTIILTSASGVITHIRHKTCFPRIGLAAGLGGACTSPVGVWLASQSPEWAIMLVAAVIIAYSAITMLRKAIKMGGKKAASSAAPAPESVDVRFADGAISAEADDSERSGETSPSSPAAPAAPLPTMGLRKCLIAFAIGLTAGVASGYVGVGGGFLMVPLMMQVLHLPMKMTSGTSLIGVFLLAIPGTILQATLGNIQWLAGISIAAGSIPGAYLGSRLIPRVPERALRLLFSGMLLLAAIMLVVNSL